MGAACLALTSLTAMQSQLAVGNKEIALLVFGLTLGPLILSPRQQPMVGPLLTRICGSTGRRPDLICGKTAILTAKLLALRCPSSPLSTEPPLDSLASTPSSCSLEPGDTDGESAPSTAPSSLASSSSP